MQNTGTASTLEADRDLETLKTLNSEYVRAVDKRNANWFDRHLAPDFMNSNPDGTLVDRQAFLAQISRGAGVSEISEHDVIIRIMKDFAIIHARTSYQEPDGIQGAGRYTDDWQLRDGRWQCVSAHVTRM